MARATRARAAGNAARHHHYGSIHNQLSGPEGVGEMFDSTRSIDTLRSEEQSTELSCSECFKTIPKQLFNFTLGACLSCCIHSKEKETEVSPPSSPSGDDTDMKVIKDKLKFYFMTPFEKWKYPDKRRFPWKLILQLASIILVTSQVALFARSKFALNDFIQGNTLTFAQLFVVRPADPVFSNPVPDPISVIYTNDALLEQLNYTANQFFYLRQVAAGPYGYQWDMSKNSDMKEPHLHLKIRRYYMGYIDPTTRHYDVSSNITTDTYLIINQTDPITTVINWAVIQDNLPKVIDFRLDFNVSSVYLTTAKVPKCFQFTIEMLIKNNMEDGNLPLDLTVETIMSACNDSDMKTVDVDAGVLSTVQTIGVDAGVIAVSLLSIMLCARSIMRSFVLVKEVRNFFIARWNWSLKWKHFLPLFNPWFVMIIISNGLVLVGTIMKLTIAYTNPDSLALVDITSIIIGLASFGQWCGLLRFLSYFDKYNMLLITLRLALPSVIRFGVCAGILYISFLLLGWLVLGPYHPKFKDPSVTSECLFSLLNGDDMFATYMEMSHTSPAAWIFSKIYLYTFISLFIYVVLSVFISLISDTYETLHDHWSDRQRGLLKDFAQDQLMRGRFRSNSHHSHHSMVESDRADYDHMRGLAEANAEVQPPVNNEQPSLLVHDPEGYLRPDRHKGMKSSIQIT